MKVREGRWKIERVTGGRKSSVVSSAPTTLWPRVRIPSTPSTLFLQKDKKSKMDTEILRGE